MTSRTAAAQRYNIISLQPRGILLATLSDIFPVYSRQTRHHG